MRPIYKISQTAEKIATDGLSLRIKEPDTLGELSPLALTLNQTFDHLEAALQRQVEFTSNASHELRTPISILLNELKWATSQKRLAEDYEESLLTCRNCAEDMKQLVESLLLLSRINEGTRSLIQKVVPLNEITEQAITALQPFADKRKIKFHLQIQPVHVLGDQPQLKQILLNLINNAIKHSPKASTIEVTLIDGKTNKKFIVEDNGKGINESKLPFIFDRFYRIKNSISSSQGHGLGLAICQSIANKHGGKITVENEVNKGCRFILSLPNPNIDRASINEEK